MNKSQAEEAAAIVSRTVTKLTEIPSDRLSEIAADLRQASGDLIATAVDRIRGADLGAAYLACFVLARRAGADLDGFARVRTQLYAEAPVQSAGILVVQAGIRFALAQEVYIIAQTNFVSRAEVDRVMARMNPAFDTAEDYAADQADSETYKALVALRAAMVADLVDRARPLPRIIQYEVFRNLPVLTLANFLYGDASRAEELRLENEMVHPAFAPRTGRALSR